MSMRMIALVVAILLSQSVSAAEPVPEQPRIRAAIEKSLPLLMKGAAGHRENRTCFACHNQGPPLMAIAAAKAKGFTIDQEEFDRELTFIADFLGKNRDNYLLGKGTGGQADTAGYALWTLADGGWKPDATTAAVAEYLLLRHKDRDHWPSSSNRPPSEATPLATTYVALRGLADYGIADQAERIAARRAQALKWLLQTPAKDNEDRVFRLLALKSAQAQSGDIEKAAQELISKQRDDGGWAQLDSGEPPAATQSDAYATGTALVALYDAGGMPTNDPIYQRGLTYLLSTQKEDGSWHVVSRSKPFQTYFETGFPHGTDQYISASASGWATWALVGACEK